MHLHQLFGGLQHTLILTADQGETAAIEPFDQGAHELQPVHLGHVEIQQDQVWRFGRTIKPSQRGAPAGATCHLGEPQIDQQTAHQLEHEGLVVEHQNSDCRFFTMIFCIYLFVPRKPRSQRTQIVIHSGHFRLEAGQQHSQCFDLAGIAGLFHRLAQLAQCQRAY
jgi:hypothetical protein